MTAMSGISVRGLNKSHGPLHVLRDINLDVAPGDFTVLLGPSGCGKSTLLSAIAGLDPIDSGSIEIGAADVTELDPSQRGIAMVFQSYALYPTMTVRRNLSFGLEVKRVPRAEITARVSRVADMLQIGALLDRKPGALSGGQRQRVAIGRALVQEARIFLFDEPLSNLDAKLRTETRVELKRLHRQLGATMLYVTHDQIEAMTLATRVAVMRGGKVEQYATPEELYERPSTLFVAGFVGSPAMSFLNGSLGADGVMALEGGIRLPLRDYPFKAPFTAGQPVVLGLRPEHVGLADDNAPGAHAAAETLFMEPMGADTLGWFQIGGQRIAARLTPQRARGIDGPVRLALDLRHASLFDRDDEERL
jgi:multiple sugar transport system ATP-binding protein